ncbi:MAG: LamG domain-containing protein [Candidatus Nanoarchaeia archaeon]|jgi:hypothetical protein
MNMKQIAGRLGTRGALKRGLIGAMLIVMMLSVLMAHYALSGDVEGSVYDKVNAGDYIDTGLDNTQGISMDLVEKGLTHKVLEFEITSEIATQDIHLLIAENNFDAKEGSLTKLNIVSREEPVYETLCNPYNLEDPVNHSVNTVQNCTAIQTGTKTVYENQWLPVELKASEKQGITSLSTFNILGKGKYRYSFNTPIVNTGSGWGNAGTVFLKVGSGLFADKQHSSWWHSSCFNRISTNINPQVTDSNMQIHINLSKEIDWKKAYVVLNTTNTSLAWLNDTQTWFWTNASVTANSAFGIDVYYNCNSDTPQYNYSNIMLLANEFETNADLQRIDPALLLLVLNTTIGQRGNSATENANAQNIKDGSWNIAQWHNTSFVVYYYTLKTSWSNAFVQFFTTTADYRFGIDTVGGSNYQVKIPAGEQNSGIAVEQSVWKKFRVHINTTANYYIDEQAVSIAQGIALPANMSGIGFYADTKAGDSWDTSFVYRDYGVYNPNYVVGAEEVFNTAPIVNINAISPATAYTNDDLNCSFIATDADNNPLSANITWYKNDVMQFSFNISIDAGNTTSNILKAENTTKGEIWNCSVIVYDGKLYSNASSTVRVISNSAPDVISYNSTSLNRTEVNYTNQSSVNFQENETVRFAVNASDADPSDTLFWYSWFVDDVIDPVAHSSWFDKAWNLFSSGLHLVRVDVNDSSNAITSMAWNVNIANVVNKFWIVDYVSPTPANGANLTSQSATITVAVTPSVITEATVKTLFHDTETDFDGTHNFTEFNTTSDAVQLSYPNIAGTYTSNVYNATEIVSWDNISWAEFLPTDGELQPQSNLVSLWHMNNNWLDSSGYNNNGTAYGAVFTTERELGSHAGSFDGSNDHVDCGNSALFDFNLASNFSISAWVKTTDTDGIIVSKMGAGPQYRGYSLMIYQGYLYMPLISDNGANNYLAVRETSTGTLTDNQWHHVAVSYDGSGQASGLKMYIDGNAIATTALSNSLTGSTLTTLPLWIGERSDGNYDFSGLIDEVAIWNRTLSAAEVEELIHQPIADLKIQVISCDDSACAGEAFTGPTGSSSYFSNPSFNDISFLNDSQWFQYKAFFETNDVDFTPSLYSVTVKAHTDAEVEDVSINNAWIDFDGSIYSMSGAGYSWSYVNSTLDVGDYAYTVYVNDTFGNINTTETRTFNVPSYEIVFNVTSGEDGSAKDNVQITCDYAGFNQNDTTNIYGPYNFPVGSWSCTFELGNYFTKTQTFVVNANKNESITLALAGKLTTEEHTMLDWLYTCWRYGDCQKLLSTINETTSKIWTEYIPTNISVVADEQFISKTLSLTSNITIDYTVNVPYKKGVDDKALLPIRIFYWFTDISGACYNQDKQSDSNTAETPFCIPLMAEYLGPNNGSVSFTVALHPSLADGTYEVVRQIDIDPPVNGAQTWINYGRENIGSIDIVNPVKEAASPVTETNQPAMTEATAPAITRLSEITGNIAKGVKSTGSLPVLIGLGMICLTLVGTACVWRKKS